jgi:RimJ/RimL family protein N-acetyltransferase
MATGISTPVLVPFRPAHAAAIASWVRDERQLQWVSPATQPPLTAEKVRGWLRPDGEAFVLVSDGDGADEMARSETGGLQSGAPVLRAPEPLAYSEINRMRRGQGNWWIGHFIVHPERRGCGLGRMLLQGLLAEAFGRLEANTVCLVVFPDNERAIRCYESAGFKRMGHEYHRFASQKHRVRLVRYEITRRCGCADVVTW